MSVVKVFYDVVMAEMACKRGYAGGKVVVATPWGDGLALSWLG